MEDTREELPGQQTFEDVTPVGRAEIDAALRGAPVNGDTPGPVKQPRGPGGQFARKGPALDEPVRQSPAAAARDRADEARARELARELEREDELDDDGCEDCGKSVDGMGRGLGVVVLAAGATLLYIGFDLISRGGLSRRLGGGARWDEPR